MQTIANEKLYLYVIKRVIGLFCEEQKYMTVQVKDIVIVF
jgi:hypothetical protein